MYCTLADLQGRIPEIRLIELTDTTSPNPTGAVQEAVVDLAIQDADAEIDSYLGQLYTLPLSVVPKVINKISIDLAVYALYLGRVESMPDGIEGRRKSALAMLQMICDGKLSLGLEQNESESVQSSTVTAHVYTGDPMFTVESMGSLGGGI